MPDEETAPDTLAQTAKRQEQQGSPYLTIEEAAERLKLSPHTLNRWRHRGEGPLFRDHGRRIVYHVDDLDRWSQDHQRQKARQYNSKKHASSDDQGGGNG